MAECEDYLDRRLAGDLVPEPAAKRIRKSKMRIVVDTNVFVGACIAAAQPRR